MSKEQLLKEVQQTTSDVWKNFKSHLEEYDSSNTETFWSDWNDDIDVMDNAYYEYPVRYIVFKYLTVGLQKTVGRWEQNEQEKKN